MRQRCVGFENPLKKHGDRRPLNEGYVEEDHKNVFPRKSNDEMVMQLCSGICPGCWNLFVFQLRRSPRTGENYVYKPCEDENDRK